MKHFAPLALVATVAAQGWSAHQGGSHPHDVKGPDCSGFSRAVVHHSQGGLAVCVSGLVSVEASTDKNIKFNFDVPANQIQVTETFVEFVTSGSPFAKQIVAGTQTAGGHFDIGATLCVPANNTKPSAVQFLTHGVGFDRSYWNFAPGYSYVDIAAQSGYATFFYDRLGVGMSSKPDPIATIQAPLEVEIADQLATMLRNGKFSNMAFSHVIGVGHSYGSIISQAITAQSPSTLDAAILTGFSINATALPLFISALNLALANQNQPHRFSGLSNGFIVSDTIISNQIGFFRSPGFDPNILSQAEATKGTTTFGELFTTLAVTGPANSFDGPVAVVNGDEDLPFCFGNCSYPTNIAAEVVPVLYPNVKAEKSATYLAPTAGHALNLHYSAVEAYKFIMEFLKKQGL